jgi:hypothetical protein
MAIAFWATEGQVIGAGRAAVLLGDDVINLERPLMVILRQLAVFASACSAGANQFFQCAIHQFFSGGRRFAKGPPRLGLDDAQKVAQEEIPI